MRIVFKTLLALAAVLLAWMCFRSIMNPIEFDAEKEIRDKAVISRLIDIRKAQIAYKESKGVYANDFKTLKEFVKNDSLEMVSKKGELTDEQMDKGLTEEIALALQPEDAAKYGIEDYDDFKANFRRDTSRVSVMESVFGKDYNIDSMEYVPFMGDTQFEMEAKMFTTVSGIEIPLFQAQTPYKVYLDGMNKQEIINLSKQATALRRYEGLRVGDSSNPNNNAGNWE